MAGTAGSFDAAGRDDAWSGGVRLIPITTPKGESRVWTKLVGKIPTVKLLLLHGGPGATHEYFEASDSFLPAAGIEDSNRRSQCSSISPSTRRSPSTSTT